MTNLSRATVILDALADMARPASLTDLATRTRLPRSTVHRVIQDLERDFYVVRAAGGPGYVLGPGAVKFGLNLHLRLLAANRQQLAYVAREVREHVALAVFSGREVVVIDEVGTPASLSHIPTNVGNSADLHATATGRALLAHIPQDLVPQLLPVDLKPFTHHTIVDRMQLAAQLDIERRSAVAVTVEEHDVGVGAIATAMTGPTGVHQAYTVVLPVSRLHAKGHRIIAALAHVNPSVDVERAIRQLPMAGRT